MGRHTDADAASAAAAPAFPWRVPLFGEYAYPDSLLADTMSESELASLVAGAREVYEQRGLSCLYYAMVPSVLLCACCCVGGVICALEKKRDKRIQAYLDVQNAERYHARGVHTEIVVDDGVWIVLSRTAPSPAPPPQPSGPPAARTAAGALQEESGPGRAARGSSDGHQQRASLASTTAVLGTDDLAASGGARDTAAAEGEDEDDEYEEEEEEENGAVVGYEDGGAERGVLGRKRKRDSLFLSSSAPAYAPIL